MSEKQKEIISSGIIDVIHSDTAIRMPEEYPVTNIINTILPFLPPDGVGVLRAEIEGDVVESRWRVIWYERIADGSYAVKLQQATVWETVGNGRN